METVWPLYLFLLLLALTLSTRYTEQPPVPCSHYICVKVRPHKKKHVRSITLCGRIDKRVQMIGLIIEDLIMNLGEKICSTVRESWSCYLILKWEVSIDQDRERKTDKKRVNHRIDQIFISLKTCNSANDNDEKYSGMQYIPAIWWRRIARGNAYRPLEG